MLSQQFLRFLHSGQSCWNSVNKSLLGKLRKKTGYSFANCRKALELHDNNIEEAEKWLQEQAQALGWSKATKLEGRPTVQGLIGVAIDKNIATIVEVNCETDFVSRNKSFQTMVDTIANVCLKFARSNMNIGQSLRKIGLDSERLKSMNTDDGKSLSDHVVLLIGSVGENVSLRRAYCFQASGEIILSGYTHPAPQHSHKTLLGKYGALVAFKKTSETKTPTEQLGRLLCQHVIGMNPSKIGEEGKDVPVGNSDEEKCMIYQEYLLDPSQTIAQFVSDAGISLIDFARFECGEELDIGSPPEQQRNIDVAIEVGG